MRLRLLLTGVAVAALAVLGGAGAAGAQEEEEPELTEESEHCIEILEEGGEVDDCQEAPSIILPATNEIIWGSISFAAVVFLLYKFAWPGLKKGLEDRSERIRDDLEEAERARTEAETVLEDYKTQVGNARQEASRIIDEARQTADALRRELQTKAEADITELRQRAAADVEAAKAQAVQDVKAEVGKIAMGATEMLVKRNLDRDTQTQLVDDYINQVLSRN
jgi:F-type H+-transporting ATPase subunit b